MNAPLTGVSPAEPARAGLSVLAPWWSALIERFVPPALQGDADQARRARLLVGFSVYCVLVAVAFGVLAEVHDHSPRMALMSATAAVVAALTPALLRRTGSVVLATSLMLAVFVAVIVLASATEGWELLTLPWLAVVPLLATTLAGRRAGVLWAAACLLLTEAQLEIGRADLPVGLVASARVRVSSEWNFALLILFVVTFAMLHESLRLKMMVALSEAHARLAAAREGAFVSDRLASLGRMAAGVAHEINNPMTFVSSNVGLLREDLARGPLDDALRREYVDDVLPATEEGIRRVVDIVADLRRFACGDPSSSVVLDLNEEVAAAVRASEEALRGRKVTLRLGAIPVLVGRPREITQLTVNLLVNAADAIEPEGAIVVETCLEGSDAVLRVCDDGTGMSVDVKERLFEPFFTTKPVGRGTGLGLAVVHGVARAHGGSVRVESEPGKGTTVEVRLPISRKV